MDDLSDAAKAADKLEGISDGTKLLPPPKELGDIARAGEKIQDGTKLEVPKKLGNVITKKKKLKAGTPEHKSQRWADYQKKKPESKMTYDEWSNRYDANMKNANKGNKTADAYHKEIGWGKREVHMYDEEGKLIRKLDIADVNAKKAVEVKDYSKSNVSLNKEITKEVNFDKSLAKEGWDVEWVFKDKGPSKPLEKVLNDPPPIKITKL